MDHSTPWDALEKFIKSRPGLDVRDYCHSWFRDPEGRRAYQRDVSALTRMRREALHALEMCRRLPWEPEVWAAIAGGRGRLTVVPSTNGKGWQVDYCAGQYYPMEYRAAAAETLKAYDRAVMRRIEALEVVG